MFHKTARKIRPKVKGFRGKEPFLKTGEMIPWDSFLERDYIRLADFDLEIEEIHSQPERIDYINNGRKHKYFPDFKVITTAHHIVLVEVKPLKFANSEKNKIKFSAARRYCQEKGWTFIVMTENEIRPGWLQVNLSRLRALGTEEIPEVTLDEMLDKLEAVGECNVDEFRQYYKDLSDGEFYAALYQLIYFQEIYYDLIELPLDDFSRIRTKE